MAGIVRGYIMGASSSVQLRPEEVSELQALSGFNGTIIGRLYSRFRKLDRSRRGYLTEVELSLIPELAMNPLCHRILASLNANKDGDDEQVILNFRDFVDRLSVFSPSAPRQRKVDFLFQIFDVDGDGSLSRGDLQKVVEAQTKGACSEEQVDEVVRQTMALADKDGDGKISRQEFEGSLEQFDIGSVLAIDFAMALEDEDD